MSKLQIGDDVEVISVDHFSLREQKLFNLKVGDNGKIIGLFKICEVFAIVENHKFKNSRAGDGKLYIPKSHLSKIGESKMQYKESNRYKLAQAIKKTGISAKALSRAVVGNESYFYNKTGVARFNKKGDISNEVLNLALTDLEFAEREVLGIGAKTVEDELYTAVVDNKGDVVDIVKTGTVEKDWIDEAVEYTGMPYNEGKPKNKSLFIGATVVIFILLFILNNYLQVV